MSTRSAPIVTATERLMTDIEAAVATFPRKHRYALGTDLRTWSRESVMCSHHAWRAVRSPDRQAQMLRQLIEHNDRLKLGLQIGHRLQAFRSRGQFEVVIVQARNVGRQAGAWLRQIQHPHGQNHCGEPRSERPETLSTRAASAQGANP